MTANSPSGGTSSKVRSVSNRSNDTLCLTSPALLQAFSVLNIEEEYGRMWSCFDT